MQVLMSVICYVSCNIIEKHPLNNQDKKLFIHNEGYFLTKTITIPGELKVADKCVELGEQILAQGAGGYASRVLAGPEPGQAGPTGAGLGLGWSGGAPLLVVAGVARNGAACRGCLKEKRSMNENWFCLRVGFFSYYYTAFFQQYVGLALMRVLPRSDKD